MKLRKIPYSTFYKSHQNRMIAVGTLESSFCVRLVRTIQREHKQKKKKLRMIRREIDVKEAPTKS